MKTDFTPEQLADPATAISERAIRTCVHCGFCTATCPTYVLLGDERDSPRGRIWLIKDMLEKDAAPTPEVVTHIDRCLSCLACTTTCPSGVDYGHLIDHARAHVEERYQRPVADKVMRWMLATVLPHRARFTAALTLGRLASPLAGVMGRRIGAMLRLAGANKTHGAKLGASAVTGAHKGRVIMQGGCAEPVLRPQYQAAAARLLNRAGYDVLRAPHEGCCGSLVHHLGRDAEALGFVRRVIDAWWPLVEEGVDAIIVTASGCGATIKDYGFLMRGDAAYAAKAARISALAKDVTELLKTADVAGKMTREVRVAYHSACSLQHGQKITSAPRLLLEAAGFRVSVPAEAHLCCGSAGTYNILQPEIAAQLGDRKVENLETLKPDVIATGNIGCAVQIGVRTGVPVVHVVELLDWAGGGPAPAGFEARETA
jgi:glycolate oxidase iron-sulfur subunit